MHDQRRQPDALNYEPPRRREPFFPRSFWRELVPAILMAGGFICGLLGYLISHAIGRPLWSLPLPYAGVGLFVAAVVVIVLQGRRDRQMLDNPPPQRTGDAGG